MMEGERILYLAAVKHLEMAFGPGGCCEGMVRVGESMIMDGLPRLLAKVAWQQQAVVTERQVCAGIARSVKDRPKTRGMEPPDWLWIAQQIEQRGVSDP